MGGQDASFSLAQDEIKTKSFRVDTRRAPPGFTDLSTPDETPSRIKARLFFSGYVFSFYYPGRTLFPFARFRSAESFFLPLQFFPFFFVLADKTQFLPTSTFSLDARRDAYRKPPPSSLPQSFSDAEILFSPALFSPPLDVPPLSNFFLDLAGSL